MQQNAPNAPAASALEQAVGSEIRKLRVREEMSIVDLSKRSGVSTAMISKIERGQVGASLVTLNALANAIGVPIANLFASTVERKEISFVAAGTGVDVRRSGSTYGHAYKLVGRALNAGIRCEAFVITLQDDAFGQPVFQHPGIEYIHMFEGEFGYRIGQEEIRLAAGDSLTFDSDMPHGPFEIRKGPVRFLTVIISRE